MSFIYASMMLDYSRLESKRDLGFRYVIMTAGMPMKIQECNTTNLGVGKRCLTKFSAIGAQLWVHVPERSRRTFMRCIAAKAGGKR
jgi:hypothetical protein